MTNLETTTKTPRTVVWFSAGAASAVAAKIVLSEQTENVVLAYTDTSSEHPDNERFINDCERWFNHPVLRLHSPDYADIYDVFLKRKFIGSQRGAPCTVHLKKRLRQNFQQDDDVQVFGYTAEENRRALIFRENNPEVNLRTPLIERGLGKSDCLALIERAGIAIPTMYLLGYKNNNCIGCIKGGMGYWNKIRVDFPEHFQRMAGIERQLGMTVLAESIGGARKTQVYLDELDPTRGNPLTEPEFECSLLCSAIDDEINLPHEEETCDE